MLLLLPSFHSSVLFLCRESSSLFPSTCFLLQMGSSYVLGGSSMNSLSGGGTESGWTNYIGSSIQNSIYIEDADRPVVDQYYYNNNGGGYGSDDSMVSDASSGPTSQYSEAAPKKKGGVFSSRKGGKEKKKLGKQGNKQRDEYSRIKLGEDDDAKSAASHTGSKPDLKEAEVDRRTASQLVRKRKQLHSTGLSVDTNRYVVKDKTSSSAAGESNC